MRLRSPPALSCISFCKRPSHYGRYHMNFHHWPNSDRRPELIQIKLIKYRYTGFIADCGKISPPIVSLLKSNDTSLILFPALSFTKAVLLRKVLSEAYTDARYFPSASSQTPQKQTVSGSVKDLDTVYLAKLKQPAENSR